MLFRALFALRGMVESMALRQGVEGERVGPLSALSIEGVARPKGFEPPTLGSEDRCSCPLSYGRVAVWCALTGRRYGKLLSRLEEG